MTPTLDHVENWVFDLDNSLYPAACDLFALVDRRIRDYVARRLDLDPDEARRVQKGFFRDHGTTLAGLMANHGVDPHDFLDYVHDIDMARLAADPALVAALDALPGRKFIFTNADERYARRVLDAIGLANAFDGFHDIHTMDYVPKPDPSAYEKLCRRLDIDPTRSLFADDMARNLAPAKAIGMATLWIDNGSEQAGGVAQPDFVDYRTNDIAVWLGEVTGKETA
ncbi:pyrimidine 5'-nucleotidase [Sphingosinicella ginsenosidimutans]|uniref:Pyrimidine 5'-nucleotidase n=1 Tax=Allosphingosinicella ginsenosidimutans TaxID=1176539 RepID=A0A5C6TSI2_9SPHN|nr:pyrimidine 5'-nucleotidase [Sphingosinicella ginsenosidimutans]TXC63354.1 pyrimidine 5'-nucleotidase [Sphingosinicella ginsenosidimutans]